MKNLGKIAKTIGQKGLMPNPKTGTVTMDVAKTIAEIKKGKVEVRVDKLSNLHNVFGKVSFDEAKLKDNLKAIVKAVLDSKPASSKGSYIKSLNVTTTMGPGISLEVNAATVEAKK
jgi:large subunit ribosomal protein L1